MHEELLAAVMQKLTPLQQSAVVKFAKKLAWQNAPQPPKTGNASVVSKKTTPKENIKIVRADGSEKGGTNKGQSQKTEIIPQLAQVANTAEELVETCPTCQRSFDTATVKVHMIEAHQSEICQTCHEPVKLTDLESHKWGHVGWATYTPCKAPTDDHDLLPPGPNNTGRYDRFSGVRILQGGLPGK